MVDASPPSLLLCLTDAPAVSAESADPPLSPASDHPATLPPDPIAVPLAAVVAFPPPTMVPILPLSPAAQLIMPVSLPDPPSLVSSSPAAPLQLPSMDLAHADGYLYLDSHGAAEFIPWLIQCGVGFTWCRAVTSVEPELPAHQMPEYLQASHSLGDWFHYTGPPKPVPLFITWERAVHAILA
ncbi:hypothetical protein EWM64_g990 [Hericium alpestre]|uniref:Uncharacterized protein n=1 Tax=Hericium alpestre TaxID=135208 RepID=A0A4Z0A906_9AGAM|nr:hypothetical protein EWM64_g990 [Hericium alpestre]